MSCDPGFRILISVQKMRPLIKHDWNWQNLIKHDWNLSNLIKLEWTWLNMNELDQTGVNLIELDRTWAHLIKLDWTWVNMIKLARTWSNLIIFWIQIRLLFDFLTFHCSEKLDNYHVAAKGRYVFPIDHKFRHYLYQ